MKILSLLVFTLISSCLFAQTKYYLQDHDPWGSINNQDALNTVFGTGNYTQVDYNANASTIFSNSTTFVMLEGGENNDLFLATFFNNNQTLIENWVSNGGHLLIKSAPWFMNIMSPINLGFSGTQISLKYHSQVSLTSEGVNTIYTGPSLPMATTYTGGMYAHATITGTDYNVLISSDDYPGESVLSYKNWGAGKIVISTMTAPDFISPSPQSQNLLNNTISFASSSAAPSFTNPGPITICELGSYYLAPSTTDGIWANSTPTVATVNSSGYVTALTAGVTDITLTSSGVTITATITVESAANYSGAPTIPVGQPSYKISNSNPVSQGPTADLFMGYSGFNYSSSTKPTNPGFYRANNVDYLANKTAGCPYTFYIFRCTTCPD